MYRCVFHASAVPALRRDLSPAFKYGPDHVRGGAEGVARGFPNKKRAGRLLRPALSNLFS
ncbi:hypothetical protein BKI51_11670 [Alphaproteobacteria bacterium AO1-B]|nr:hypothetical protein BKI51_11670 [Alphaproteobacteria bacterium AO1-B]